MIGKMGAIGEATFEVIKPQKAPFEWRIRNMLTWIYISGWVATKIIAPIANRLGIATFTSELSIKVRKGETGEWIDYGVVSRRVITNAGVTFLRDAWNSAATWSNMNFHGIGTGTNAENVTDTALQTESTTALNPDSTRATGTKSTPASNQWRSIGTLTCDANIAVTEHGIFDQAATGGGTLWDRSVFTVINLVGANPDSIQCTYTATLTAGG